MSAANVSSMLPVYEPSAPSPCYSSEPWPDEQRLELTPRQAARPRPTGVFTKRSQYIRLVLYEQEVDAVLPTYGRNGVVHGIIEVEDSENITSVALKLEGRLSLTIAEGGSTSQSLLHQRHTMWKNTSPSSACPKSIPFVCILPSTYADGDKTRPLPPSYSAAFPGVPGLSVESFYTLSVIITRSQKLALWKRRKSLSTRLQYYPRTRPHRPILPSHFTFLSTLKPSPEEWHQVISVMQTRPSSSLTPITCNLFIPSVQIWALSDTIPFHVQLCAPLPSLHEFLPPTVLPTPTGSSHFRTPVIPQPTIRVYLLRQISVEVRGQKAWRNYELGEGKLRSVPPPASTDFLPPSYDESTLDWEGEVRCKEDTTSGGFNAGKMTVKDFLVLALSPPKPETSPLMVHQLAHPIRLVTDTWTDLVGPVEERR